MLRQGLAEDNLKQLQKMMEEAHLPAGLRTQHPRQAFADRFDYVPDAQSAKLPWHARSRLPLAQSVQSSVDRTCLIEFETSSCDGSQFNCREKIVPGPLSQLWLGAHPVL